MKRLELFGPGGPAKRAYIGPGWPEWLLGLACTILISTQVRDLGRAKLPQTLESYYFAASNAERIHTLAVGVDILILLFIAAWIIRGSLKKWLEPIVIGLAIMGFGLVWYELVGAMALHLPQAEFTELPYRPMNQFGLVGSGVFGAYLIAKIQMPKLKPVASVLIKLAFVICSYLMQLMFFDFLMGIKK
ncbi:MAG: hypothetical protein KDC26_06405 [Armatimonadetes bacterium]|nr:hypothetical protein [Armatimonadota bacterium]